MPADLYWWVSGWCGCNRNIPLGLKKNVETWMWTTSCHRFSATDKHDVSVVISPVCAINPLDEDLFLKLQYLYNIKYLKYQMF